MNKIARLEILTFLLIITLLSRCVFSANDLNSSKPQQVDIKGSTDISLDIKNSDSLKTAKAELKAEIYKNALEAQQKLIEERLNAIQESQKERSDLIEKRIGDFKWMIGTIIVLLLGLAAYIGYGKRREYEKAVADAKEAAKEARSWERESHEMLTNLDVKINTKLEEVNEKGQAQIERLSKEFEAKIKEIVKAGEKQKDTITKEAEKQRRINKIWSEGMRALKAEDFETAAGCFGQIADDPELKDKDTKSFAFTNWGTALSEQAKRKKDDAEADKFFTQACEKYQKGVDIKHDDHEAFDNWGAALLDWAKRKSGKEKSDMLEKAKEKCLKAESLKPGSGSYDLGCAFALEGNENECRKWLENSEKYGTLATREHAMKDNDLKSVRDKGWFKKLRFEGE